MITAIRDSRVETIFFFKSLLWTFYLWVWKAKRLATRVKRLFPGRCNPPRLSRSWKRLQKAIWGCSWWSKLMYSLIASIAERNMSPCATLSFVFNTFVATYQNYPYNKGNAFWRVIDFHLFLWKLVDGKNWVENVWFHKSYRDFM